MSQNDPRSEAENPYASPATSYQTPEVGSPEVSEEEQLRAFFGPNASYYLGKWTDSRGGRGAGRGFNWAAFLLSGFWLGFRKMYQVSLIFYGVIALESILEDVVFVGMLGRQTPLVLERGVALAAAVVCGVFGNRWYFSHARKVIAKVRATGLQGDQLLHALAQRGGTSVAASLGMFALFFVGLFVVFIALEFLLYGNLLDAGP